MQTSLIVHQDNKPTDEDDTAWWALYVNKDRAERAHGGLEGWEGLAEEKYASSST